MNSLNSTKAIEFPQNIFLNLLKISVFTVEWLEFSIPQHQQDTCEKQDLLIDSNSCFSDLSDSLNFHLGKTPLMHKPVHLKMIAITPDSIVKWLAHWPSTEEILGTNSFDCSFFVIKFNEFINNLSAKNSNKQLLPITGVFVLFGEGERMGV